MLWHNKFIYTNWIWNPKVCSII